MNKTRIPSISLKRARECGEVDSQPPRYKRASGKSPLAEITNTASSSPHISEDKMLSTKSMFGSSGQSSRLMNKYYYGDPRVIEEVKRRERKVMKDIQHFKKSIEEVERDMKTMVEESIPGLRYTLSKKAAVYKDLRVETAQVTARLDLLANKCGVMRANTELALNNITLEQQVEVQNLENELDRRINALREEWELKLLSLEKFKPNDDLVKEIEGLKQELNKEQKTWDRLQRENEEKRKEFELILEQDFLRFKEEKLSLYEDLTEKREHLFQEKNKKQLELKQLHSIVEQHRREKAELAIDIQAITEEIVHYEQQLKPSQARLQQLKEQLNTEVHETEEIRKKASAAEQEYNTLYDKMEDEQLSRRRIENTIEELRGNIRVFAYVSDASVPYTIDYASKTITVGSAKQYCFDRLIPKELVPLQELLEQECQAYMDMCLQNQYDSSVISLQQENDHSIRNTFIGWMLSQKHKRINFQCVVLSENSPSVDLLLRKRLSGETNREIKVTLDNKSVLFESTSILVESGGSAEDIIKQLGTDYNKEGILILKFQIWGENETSTDVYFIEVTPPAYNCLHSTGSAGSTGSSFGSSRIGAILRSLLMHTKPLLLLTLTQENSLLLDISQQIGQREKQQPA
ncbi:AFL170Cp [Eremothecium gossypii ATCC 10895]|uniref:AFL170Cp n=1 Tax=Eremothecium gossypii (strain ATCC 10895 / CBS 109.51 / FGSC 9923 / NRRL Y-1056) TaxID=284811 RepID=Q755J3_EREGS|nr:AFL170Cp [Eremothecium gossypii ATCC 10895]AAS53204.1 AFL170Cp [Eremothecium gossypii ATCC 10895]AEY97514.1 FAFL170Cp [Eremothecium gossypii FDAG1]